MGIPVKKAPLPEPNNKAIPSPGYSDEELSRLSKRAADEAVPGVTYAGAYQENQPRVKKKA